jgi:hypothetical protein
MTVSIRMNTVSTRISSERPRSMPAWSRSVRSLPVLKRLIHGRSRMSTNKQDLSLLRRYPWSSVTGRVLSRINPCTIRIHPSSSIENTCTRMVLVFTRSLRSLLGTSRFIHGTNTVDFRPGRSGRKIKTCLIFCAHSRMVPDDARCLHGLYTVYHGPPRIISRTITDWRSGMIRHLIRECVKGAYGWFNKRYTVLMLIFS